MRIGFKISGTKSFKKRLKKAEKSGASCISKALFKAANVVKNQAVRDMHSISQGEIYRRGSVNHTASKPGDAPNVDTGTLVNSLFVAKVDQLTYKVGTNIDYGTHLEFGTRNMAARPWLKPAFNKTKEDQKKAYENTYEKCMRKIK